MKKFLPILFLLSFLMACGDANIFSKANYTSALSKLRKYSTVNYIVYMERMAFAKNLSILHKEGYISEKFFNAWDGNSEPVPFQGYLFTDITEGVNGNRLDSRKQSGLCAYPSNPGSSGSKILLMLLDPRYEEIVKGGPGGGEPDFYGGGAVSSGGFIILEADYEKVGGPVRQWPSDNEIGSTYKNLTLTVEQGLKKSKELFENARNRDMM